MAEVALISKFLSFMLTLVQILLMLYYSTQSFKTPVELRDEDGAMRTAMGKRATASQMAFEKLRDCAIENLCKSLKAQLAEANQEVDDCCKDCDCNCKNKQEKESKKKPVFGAKK